MNYVRIIDEFNIDRDVPRETYDSEGRLVVGDLTTKPELLKALDFYPLEESQTEIPDGYHAVMHYTHDAENERNIETAELVKDPDPPPTQYSKVKILLAANNAGLSESLLGLFEANVMLKLIWDASNTIENNELLGQYLPDIATALGKTEQEVMDFLDENCVVD